MPFPILAFMGLCKVCSVVVGACVCAWKVAEANDKWQKTRQNKIDADLQIDQTKLDIANQNRQNFQKEKNEINKKSEESDKRVKELENKIEELKGKAKDPNISQDERNKYASQIVVLQSQLDEIRNDKRKFASKSKDIDDKIKKEDKNINLTGSGSYNNDRHWIWDLITIENMLILGDCYMLYKLSSNKD